MNLGPECNLSKCSDKVIEDEFAFDSDDDIFSQIETDYQNPTDKSKSVVSAELQGSKSNCVDAFISVSSEKTELQIENKRSTDKGLTTSICDIMAPQAVNSISRKRFIVSSSNSRNNVGSEEESPYGNKLPRTDSEAAAAFDRFTGHGGVYRLKRRFPGPAGLLPTIKADELKVLNEEPHPLSQQFSKIIAHDSVIADKEVEALQGIIPGLEPRCENEQICLRKAPWKEILKQLELQVDNTDCILNLMNIQWIRTKALKLPVCLKIPFLVAVLKEAPELIGGGNRASLKNPTVKLIDSTGSMLAAMDAHFVEDYRAELLPGTALALKNVGILRFKRQAILTITRKNLICMTACRVIESSIITSEIDGSPSSASLPSRFRRRIEKQDENLPIVTITKDDVRVLKFSEFCPSTLLEEYHYMCNARADDFDEIESEPITTVGLFSSYEKQPNLKNSEYFQSPAQHRLNTASVPQKPINLESLETTSGFDDDDEFFRALDNIDFGNDTEGF